MTGAAQPGLVIETPRLLLRHLVPEDWQMLYEFQSDPVMMRHFPHPFSEAESREWVERNVRRYAEFGTGMFAIVLKETGKLIGTGGPSWEETTRGRELEVGYQIRRDHWGKGYAAEAARACMQFAFEQFDVDHVASYIRPANTQSQRVAEKNGLRPVDEILFHGLPHVVYSITREDFYSRESSAGSPAAT